MANKLNYVITEIPLPHSKQWIFSSPKYENDDTSFLLIFQTIREDFLGVPSFHVFFCFRVETRKSRKRSGKSGKWKRCWSSRGWKKKPVPRRVARRRADWTLPSWFSISPYLPPPSLSDLPTGTKYQP